MERQTIFAFRVNKDERQLITRLASLLDRSQSDAVRFVIRQVVNSIGDKPKGQGESLVSESEIREVKYVS
jgi:hypothetical protein